MKITVFKNIHVENGTTHECFNLHFMKSLHQSLKITVLLLNYETSSIISTTRLSISLTSTEYTPF